MGFHRKPGVDVSDADALVTDVINPKTFYSVAAPRKTGTMPTVALAPGSDEYPAGYHAGNVGGLVAIDEHLAPENIKLGVNIFGKVGTFAPVDPLTVELFQTNPATGTMTFPERLNDTETGVASAIATVGQYAEVDFGRFFTVSQFRQYGHTNQNGDGEWKLQYWDGADWQDWHTGIPTRTLASWSNWESPANPIIASKLRLVCVVKDTSGSGQSGIVELEAKY